MEDFAKKWMNVVSAKAQEFESEMRFGVVPDEEIYADDPELQEVVRSAGGLYKESKELVKAVKAYAHLVVESAQCEEHVARAMAPPATLEHILPSNVTIGWVALASVKVSMSSNMEKDALANAQKTADDFRIIRDRYNVGFATYEREYKHLRREVVKMQKRTHSTTVQSELDMIKAKLEASDPVWRAKGESLKAEGQALAKILEEFNMKLIDKLVNSRLTVLKTALTDVEEVARTSLSTAPQEPAPVGDEAPEGETDASKDGGDSAAEKGTEPST